MSSEPKFTPGPWRFETTWTGMFRVYNEKGVVVCSGPRIYAGPGPCRDLDAHLIAAAPAMYEALLNAKNALHLNPESCQDEINATLGNIDSALALADGKAKP